MSMNPTPELHGGSSPDTTQPLNPNSKPSNHGLGLDFGFISDLFPRLLFRASKYTIAAFSAAIIYPSIELFNYANITILDVVDMCKVEVDRINAETDRLNADIDRINAVAETGDIRAIRAEADRIGAN